MEQLQLPFPPTPMTPKLTDAWLLELSRKDSSASLESLFQQQRQQFESCINYEKENNTDAN